VALLFIDFERPNRLRVNGRACIDDDDPLLAEFDGAQLIVRVRAERIFPNRPRYIRRLHGDEPSANVPRLGHVPSIAKWKRFDAFRDVLASRRSGRWRARLKLPNSDARSSKDSLLGTLGLAVMAI
jgi:hypothetical protein